MVYNTIDGRHICDDIAYINPDNGYKITAFLENARVCDPENNDDVCKCMKRLREFHDMKLKVNHEFDIFGQLEFYESLWMVRLLHTDITGRLRKMSFHSDRI